MIGTYRKNSMTIIEVAESIRVKVDENDTSTAQRVPGREMGGLVIIDRYAKRVMKTQKLRNKKKLKKNGNNDNLRRHITC